jgi:hypothetical protein
VTPWWAVSNDRPYRDSYFGPEVRFEWISPNRFWTVREWLKHGGR